MIVNALKEILKNHSLCEIYKNTENTDKFFVGYIVAVDEHNTLLLCIDFYGHYDGLSCFMNDEIFNVQIDTKYLKAIEKLIKHRNLDIKRTYPINNIFLNTLSNIENEKRICQIELCDSNLEDAVGYIKSFQSNSIIELDLIDEFGNRNGSAKIDINTVSYLSYDSTDMIRLEILNSNLD